MNNILGLHFGHDGSVSIVKNGRLCVAISNERLSRVKKEYGVTLDMIQYCLEAANLTINDIDCASCTEWFEKYTGEGIQVETEIKSKEVNQRLFANQISINNSITIMGKKIPMIFIPHHLAHISAAFYTSNLDNAFCLSIDACGQPLWDSQLSYGCGIDIIFVKFPFVTCGQLYNTVTSNLLIGNPLYKAGSTMGLACYGQVNSELQKPEVKYDYLKRMVASSPFLANRNDLNFIWKSLSGLGDDESISISKKYDKHSMNIAADAQFLFEECILTVVNQLCINKDAFQTDNICLSGGSFLNCNVNSRILKESRFKSVHLFPACSDDGLSVGSALFVAHAVLRAPRQHYQPQDICYLGKDISSVPTDVQRVAQAVATGKIVGLMQGRSEFGPRALGNRSLLADPRNFHNRELLNFLIKKREWFRPFAPSVLAEKSSEWFDFPVESPFMLFTAQVKQPEKVPAITHIDGSARMQTVCRNFNPVYYDIIKEFDKLTGVPMVLNTSLNGDGEPILENEAEARIFFNNRPIDMMVVNGKIWEK